MTYIKYTNGSTNLLINMYDEVKQNEAIESGFHMVQDEDGSPAIIESENLIRSNNSKHSAIIDSVLEKKNKQKSEKEIIKGMV